MHLFHTSEIHGRAEIFFGGVDEETNFGSNCWIYAARPEGPRLRPLLGPGEIEISLSFWVVGWRSPVSFPPSARLHAKIVYFLKTWCLKRLYFTNMGGGRWSYSSHIFVIFVFIRIKYISTFTFVFIFIYLCRRSDGWERPLCKFALPQERVEIEAVSYKISFDGWHGVSPSLIFVIFEIIRLNSG